MRPLEIALTLSLLLSLLFLMSPPRYGGTWFGLALLLVVVLTLCHVIVEGYRWQMFPAYLLIILLLIYPIVDHRIGRNTSYFTAVAGLCCLGAAVLLSTILPVFALPIPTGPYKIATQVRYLVDRSRRETFSENPDAWRELMI